MDLDAGVLRVRNSWDRKAGLILPKSRAGRRTVPIAQALRRELRAHVFAAADGRASSSAALTPSPSAIPESKTALTGLGRMPA